MKDITTIASRLTMDTVNELELKAFDLEDAGDITLNNISLTDLEAVYKEMMLPSEEK